MDALSNGLVYKLALMFLKWCEYFLKDFDLLVIFIFGEVNGLPGPLASTHLICFTANNASWGKSTFQNLCILEVLNLVVWLLDFLDYC